MSAREVEEESLLAALIGISEMMGDLTDLDEMLETIVRIAPRLASVNRCAIFLRDAQAREFRATHAFSPDEEKTNRLRGLAVREADMPQLARKLEQMVPVLFREARGPMLPEPIVGSFDIRSMLIVPLAFQGDVLGFLALDEAGSDHVFTSQQVNVANSIASHTAIAIAHARLQEGFRVERNRSAAIAQALSDGIITTDLTLRIASFTPGAEALLGWRSEEVVGKPCEELADPAEGDGAAALSALAAKALGGALRAGARVPFRAKDGGAVPCLVAATAVVPLEGKPVEVVFALTRIQPVRRATTRHPEKTSEG